jgi:hypothetical protein
MIQNIFHQDCPKRTGEDDESPEFKWGGFSMAGFADYVCEACGTTLFVADEADYEVLNRYIHEYTLWENDKPTKITQKWLDEDVKLVNEASKSNWQWKRTEHNGPSTK